MGVNKILSVCYVNRKDQIDELKRRINTIRLGEKHTVFESIIEWYGIPGIGKTTLLHEMLGQKCNEMNVPYAYINFDANENNNASRYEEDEITIIEDIFKDVGMHKPEIFIRALERYRIAKDVHLKEERKRIAITEFINYFKVLLTKDPIVLMFDTTNKATPQIISWLEENIMSPLCLTGRCIIVWTGRFQQRWKQFEIRRRIVSYKLSPLHPDATEEQVGSQGARIHELTNGHPLGNQAVAQTIRKFQTKGKEAQTHELMEELVNIVIKNYVMKDISPPIEEACRVLSIVRQFDVMILRKILTKYVHHYSETEAFLKVIGQLTETSLVEWNKVRKGYALDDTVRHILSLHMQLNHKERFLRINETASEIYDEWIDRVSENRSIYILEKLYHMSTIFRCENDQISSTNMENIKDQLISYLEAYYQKKDTEMVMVDIIKLYEEINKDLELEKMIGRENFEVLIETVQNHRIHLENWKDE